MKTLLYCQNVIASPLAWLISALSPLLTGDMGDDDRHTIFDISP